MASNLPRTLTKTKKSKRYHLLSEGSNSNGDEKKDSDCESAKSGGLVATMGPASGGPTVDGQQLIEGNDFPDSSVEMQPPAAGFLVQQAASPPPGNGDVAEIRRNVAATNKGLHHRHHFHAQSSPGAPGNHFLGHQTPTPTRRRRARSRGQSEHAHHNNRKRKWTAMQVFRTLLGGGTALYFCVMLRGTQILMDQQGANDENQVPPRGGLSDYFPMQLPTGYVAHPAIQGYLRSGALSIESLAPFLNKATNDNPDAVKQAVQQRLTERRERTRPPNPQPVASSIPVYAVVPAEQRPQEKRIGQPTEEKVSTLAAETRLCGVHASRARENNPEYFLEKDALMSSEVKVLITGIVSNPLAYHLALTLKERCGVEVLVGIDSLLPNSIRNRLQYMEQMQVLASNAPRMQSVLVPLLGLDPRVKKSKKESEPGNPAMLELTGELNLLDFEPTHIVHLSVASYQNPVSTKLTQSSMAPKRPLSPYQTSKVDAYDPSLFHVRSSMMAMEQILSSAVSSIEEDGGPHITYASATMNTATSSMSEDAILLYSKLADEVLADTYQSLFGAYSVGVRLPPNAIYGPWDSKSNMHHLLHGAIKGNFTKPIKKSGTQELIYVQDGVDAVISAMQYRESNATHFDLTGNSVVALSLIPAVAEGFLTSMSTSGTDLLQAPLEHPDGQAERTAQKLKWKPVMPLRDGILRTLAWLLDRTSPYGPVPVLEATNRLSSESPPIGSGDALLVANSVPTCAADDIACHSGPTYLPCASECSIKAQCQSSIFDSVQQLSREMTEGCDAVLYTQSLAVDLEDLQLQSQFEDDVEPAICNLAYVAQSSPLVKAVIEKIPKVELERLGVPLNSRFGDKLKKLNGRLLYRGWILLWVDPVEPIPLTDFSFLKLSPGRLFSDDVLYGVFVEENFTVSPTTDDVRFLISQMDREATKQRNVYRTIKKDEHSKPKKVKFTIPGQLQKRSSILVSQLKFKISDRGRIPQDTKISIVDAVRFMRFEIGTDPTKQKESAAIKRQKDFYRRIPTFVNGKDLRDNFEPIYKYEVKHWVRTRWVVHDLTLEESRKLRCDWYQEHVQWGSEIDQLSFAAVMARRIIDRRMTLMESDDRTKSKAASIAELKEITDHNEWFEMATENSKKQLLNDFSSRGQEELGVEDKDEADEDGAEEGLHILAGPGYKNNNKPDVGLYVRVISDRIMSLSRKAWSRYKTDLGQAGKELRH